MKRYLWIIIAIVLVTAMLAGIVLLRRPGTSSEEAGSTNGETEIIPDDPNEPWPDLEADSSSTASSDPGAASLPTASSDASASSGNTATASGGSAVDSAVTSDASTSSDSSVSSEVSASSGNSASSGSNPDSGTTSGPSSGSEDSAPAVSAEGLHEYELPYIPLS